MLTCTGFVGEGGNADLYSVYEGERVGGKILTCRGFVGEGGGGEC